VCTRPCSPPPFFLIHPSQFVPSAVKGGRLGILFLFLMSWTLHDFSFSGMLACGVISSGFFVIFRDLFRIFGYGIFVCLAVLLIHGGAPWVVGFFCRGGLDLPAPTQPKQAPGAPGFFVFYFFFAFCFFISYGGLAWCSGPSCSAICRLLDWGIWVGDFPSHRASVSCSYRFSFCL